MEERLDELNDVSYQLMMDIQTGRMVDTPRLTRGWILLGLVAVVLGGLAGLLLVSGNRTNETTDLKQAPVSTFAGHTPQPRSRARQDLVDAFVRSSPPEEDTPPAYTPLEEPGSIAIRPSSDRKAGPGTKSVSAPPMTTYAPKPASTRPTRVNKPNREPDRLRKDPPQRTVQRRSLQFSTRSVDADFDPNAERVRSSP
jgi:hypothetical protein